MFSSYCNHNFHSWVNENNNNMQSKGDNREKVHTTIYIGSSLTTNYI